MRAEGCHPLKDGFQRPGSCSLLLFSSYLWTQRWPRAKSNKGSSPSMWGGQCPSHQPREIAKALFGDKLSMENAAVTRADHSSVSWGCALVLSRGKSNCRGVGITCSVALIRSGLWVWFSKARNSSWQDSYQSDGEQEDAMSPPMTAPWGKLGLSSEHVTSCTMPRDDSVSKQFPLIHHCFLW